MAANDHAIVVGISAYPGIGSLEGPCNDVALFMQWLKKADGGNVPGKNIRQCLSTSVQFGTSSVTQTEEARPHREDIEKLFRPYVKNGVLGKKIGRRLYIFVSGHGFSDAADSYKNAMNTALYTANADQISGLHVAVTSYAEWFAQAAIFDEIVLVMDCCRTKSHLHTYTHPQLPKINPDESKTISVRKFYAFAAPWGHVAKEKEMPDRGNMVYGIFTIALLEALDKAKPNRLGNVKGKDIEQYIHNVIDEIAGETEVTPPAIYLERYKDIIWLKRKDKTSPHKPDVTVTLSEFRGNEVCIIQNGSLDMLDSIPFESSRLTVSLEAGLYKFSIKGTDRNQLIELLNDDIEITL